MKLSLDNNVEMIIRLAKEDAIKSNNYILTAERVMYVLLQLRSFNELFKTMEINTNSMKAELLRHIIDYEKDFNDKTLLRYKNNSKNDLFISESYNCLMEAAHVNSAKEKRNIVGIADLLLAFNILEYQNSSSFKYSDYVDFTKLKESLGDEFENAQGEDSDEFELEMFTQMLQDDENAHDDNYSDEDKSILSKLTTNMCEESKHNDFLFIGKEQIIYNMYEVLLRKNKNNIILLGEPGVGKTALVQELAKRIALNAVPDELKGYTLMNLDIISLVAGTRYRGDFEDRVKKLIEALISMKKCILFLDDIHNIITAGSTAGNSNDFGDLIKPLLVDNVVRCIGATNYKEIKNFEKEASLLRRFNIIEVGEATSSETLEILEKIKPQYQKFFGVTYSKKVLQDMVSLSEKYIHERAFPDKAIDLMDAIGAYKKLDFYKTEQNSDITKQDTHTADREAKIESTDTPAKLREISVKDVEEIVSRITKRPVHTIQKDEFSNLKNLSKKLSKKIFGQSYAVETLSKVIIRARSGLREDSKPIASLLFVGPTGVGKTEISKQLAHELGMNFQRYDMSEYQERHTVSKFIGSPPGYVGFDEGGILIDCIRRHPHTVLLLDEIEKAHGDLFNLLLQIMDYATITDSKGRKADFRNVIIIMTSNAGAHDSLKKVLGFEESQYKGLSEIKAAVNELFLPEFRNRLDETIVFSSLNLTHIKSIVVLELNKIRSKLSEKNIKLEWDTKSVMYLVKHGYSQVYGARNVLRIIESEVKDKLAELIIQKQSDHSTKMIYKLTLETNDVHKNEIVINCKEIKKKEVKLV